MSNPSLQDSPLFQILMNTLQELWVIKDRQMILEKVLEDQGIEVTEAIERLQPDPELAGRIDAERKRFLDTVLEPANPDD